METNYLSASFGSNASIDIDSYIQTGGFSGYTNALNLQPHEVIEEVVQSGLRGRGGAGFPTGMKLKFTAASVSDTKFVVCNADEGEPGTFKDKQIMEFNPFAFLEGMIIASYAIGAHQGYVYIRGEYYQSIEKTQQAIEQMRSAGYLDYGENKASYSFDIHIKIGAGSYLCGEELTLIESMEGKRGNPRIKPPFPAQKGFLQQPTLVNNVETLANLPLIMRLGSSGYKKIGVPTSPGTKLFCLSGDITKPGCYEAPLGTPLHTLLYDFGGGIKNGKKAKAFLLGGAAGTFIPAEMIDISMDYQSLSDQKATLGSGAIMVFDESRSISKIIGEIISFFAHESCGKCVPCRTGMVLLKEMWNNSSTDKQWIAAAEKEASYMAKTSLCPLGQSPILSISSAIQHFSNELFD